MIPRRKPPACEEASLPAEEGSVQVGTVPWRMANGGRIEVLLITSSRRKRWIVPKGWPMPGKTLRESACQEAFEEAGIRGRAPEEPFGSFIIDKLYPNGDVRMLSVVVYPLEVIEELAEWPERELRQRRWYEAGEAIAVAEPSALKDLLREFSASVRVGG